MFPPCRAAKEWVNFLTACPYNGTCCSATALHTLLSLSLSPVGGWGGGGGDGGARVAPHSTLGIEIHINPLLYDCIYSVSSSLVIIAWFHGCSYYVVLSKYINFGEGVGSIKYVGFNRKNHSRIERFCGLVHIIVLTEMAQEWLCRCFLTLLSVQDAAAT
jgi:hypothetical protein